MKTFARIENSAVAELLTVPDDFDMAAVFSADLVWVDVTDQSPQPDQRWSYSDGVFTEPPQQESLSPSDILSANRSTQSSYLATATAAIAPLQDAVDLDVASATETALLKQWKQYRVAVNRIDLTLESPPWPAAPTP